MIQILKENFILHRHKWLTVTEVSKKNVKREMNEFLEQMKSDDVTSISLTFKTIAFDEFDWNFYKVFDEVIIFYKNLIHFSDNNKFVSKIWSTTSILNIIKWWIAYFEALIKLNLVIKSAFKNIENWWIYQLFCDWKSIISSS